MGIDGESQDGSHEKWIDESGADSSVSQQPAAEAESVTDGRQSAQPAAAQEKTGVSVNVVAIVLAGLMLLALGTVAVIANNKKGDSAVDAEEVVFEPEIVLLDEGSAKLNVLYSTADSEFFNSAGDDDIDLSIVKNEDTPELYEVTGTLNSTQKVGIEGMDQGQVCTVEILHEVLYSVQGIFSSAGCKFEISVTMAPSSSQLLAQGCSVDINLDPSALFIAPRPGKMTFTRVFETVISEAFSFHFHDVALPSGVSCPAFSSP
jgi:hypothetical protein